MAGSLQRAGALLFLLFIAAFEGAPAQTITRPSIDIPRVSRPPKLEDFQDMQPNSELAGQLAKVESFIQRNPKDGAPSSQRTEVYLGYDDKNFYSIFIRIDAEPHNVRAGMVRREDILDDDAVQLMLDTFNDQRRVEFTARHQQLDPDVLVPGKRLRWTSGGSNIYIRGHNLKIQLDYTFRRGPWQVVKTDVLQIPMQPDF